MTKIHRLSPLAKIFADAIRSGVTGNPNHEPAGSPTGGQFSSGGGAGGSNPIKQTEGLRQFMRFTTENGGVRGRDSFVLKYGRAYKFDASSFKGKRDQAKMCFMNASHVAINDSSRTYVEGYVSFMGIPIHHAWTVDKSGKVFDSTIKNDENIGGYYGVPFTTDYVMKTMVKTKVYGVISHTNRGLFDAKPAEFIRSEAAQNLLAANHDSSLTIDDVMAKITLKQRDMIAKAERELSTMKSTRDEFVNDKGQYTTERAALHEKILEEFFTEKAIRDATPAAGEKPTLTLTGGRPAAGKTSALKNVISEQANKSLYISADTIQEHLPGYKSDHAGVFNLEAQDIALKAEAVALKAGLNVTYDATMKSFIPMDARVDLFKQAGYEVDAYFVHTTPEVSAVRSAERFERTGRYVPPHVSFNSRTNEKTFDTLIPKFRNWAIFDNNGDKPVWVAGGSK